VPFSTVIFDCDSTLSTIEGIEELATKHRAEIARLTEDAMRGKIALEDIYGQRLSVVQPTRAQVDALGDRYIETRVPDAKDVVRALIEEGIDVRVVSGGVLPAVRAVARELGVGEDAVAAVDLQFHEDGTYRGFDVDSPLTKSHGKCNVLEGWMPSMRHPIMMVGDGATDLETRPFVDLFVAFAGVVDRPNVTSVADVVISANTLAPIFALALGRAPRNESWRALYDKGRALLPTGAFEGFA
jgi:phosphoserine phosphatase